MKKAELLNLKIDAPDQSYAEKIRDIWDGISKPLDSMGAFEKLSARLGAITQSVHPDIQKRAVIVMCGDNGIVEEGVTQSEQDVTGVVTRLLGLGQSAVCRLAHAAKVDVWPIDIGVNSTDVYEGVWQQKVRRGTRNFAKEPAMTEEEVLQAIACGINAVRKCQKEGYGILAIGEMGIGNTTTSAAIASALLQSEPEMMTGRGAGLDTARLNKKLAVIREAIERYDLYHQDPLVVLEDVGGLDIAGLTGVCIGGACCHIPIVLDGVITCTAAVLAERICPGTREYLIASHVSREPAGEKLLQELGLQPIIHGDLALGEGTGAVMLFSLLDTAFSLYEDHVTFQGASLTPYEHFEDEGC